MAKKKVSSPAKGKLMQKFDVRGMPKAALMRIEQYIRVECEIEGGRVIVANSAPSPSCGGPGDPC
jgi:hypothetical protein